MNNYSHYIATYTMVVMNVCVCETLFKHTFIVGGRGTCMMKIMLKQPLKQ